MFYFNNYLIYDVYYNVVFVRKNSWNATLSSFLAAQSTGTITAQLDAHQNPCGVGLTESFQTTLTWQQWTELNMSQSGWVCDF